MRKSRFTESQIVQILKSVEAGRTVKDVCREHGVSDATYYNWKAKYGGMEASDIRRLKDLEEENRRLKQMFADLSLENRALKDVIEKSSEALGAPRPGRLCAYGAWFEYPAGVCGDRAPSLGLSLSAGFDAG